MPNTREVEGNTKELQTHTLQGEASPVAQINITRALTSMLLTVTLIASVSLSVMVRNSFMIYAARDMKKDTVVRERDG